MSLISESNEEKVNAMLDRYAQFVAVSDKVDQLPVRVFDPLPKQITDEIELIRKITLYLQTKKEEDLLKAKQAAEEAANEAKTVSETKEEVLEDKEKDAAKESTDAV